MTHALGRAVRRWTLATVVLTACLLLGYGVGTAVGAGISEIVFPLGSTAATFALRDDRVSSDVRFVLATRSDRRMSTTTVEGGTIAVAVSGDRTMVAVGLSSVRPATTEGGKRQVGLLLLCADDAVSLGDLGEGFFTGPQGEGWENSVALEVPAECTHIVIAVHDGKGDVISHSTIPLRDVARPVGDLARAGEP